MSSLGKTQIQASLTRRSTAKPTPDQMTTRCTCPSDHAPPSGDLIPTTTAQARMPAHHQWQKVTVHHKALI